MIKRYFSFIVLVGGLLAAAVWMSPPPAVGREGAVAGGEDGQASVKFSHRFHTEDGGLACVDCHAAAATSRSVSDNLNAGHDNCTGCHQEQVDNTCGYCHSDPDNIQPVVVPDRALIFSHEQHLKKSGVECATCHAGVGQSEDLASISVPPMETCYTCHNGAAATNTCEACHTEFVTLVPADHRRSDFLRNHRDFTRLGGLEESCATCHTETFCQDCHQMRELKQFGVRDLMSEPDPRRATKDDPDQTILQNVHTLNYRFSHGVDARARQAECSTCHEVQNFCVECHQAGGNINQVKFKPASHNVAGFTTLGAGTGGGLHAEEAKRDMESCIGCHDVEGQDPTCLTCHTDGGGVR